MVLWEKIFYFAMTCATTESFQSPLLKTLQERGFLYQVTSPKSLDNVLNKGAVTAYLGCDVTAPSLHVGNLLGLMVVRWMMSYNHKVLLLLGGATTKIGDPSGKDEQRKLLTEDVIEKNTQGIQECYRRICGQDIAVVNNKDWLLSIGYIDFLRDIGVHFSVNRMLSFDSVKSRLDRQQSLSFIEFNYMLLQSYDFLHLFQENHCQLQLGGSDQWGNIIGGVELVKKIHNTEVFGLTWPLMETSSGQKMGKSAAGALWLDPSLCSPYNYWQFWRRVEDNDVYGFLRLYTLLPMETLEPFKTMEGQDLDKGKILLANEATALLHGDDCLRNIHSAVSYVFLDEKNPKNSNDSEESPKDFSVHKNNHEENTEILLTLWDTLPRVEVPFHQWKEGKRLSELLEEFGFVKSRKEGRERLKAGSTKINHEIFIEELSVLPYYHEKDSWIGNKNHQEGLQPKKIFLLTFGGKKQGLIGIV